MRKYRRAILGGNFTTSTIAANNVEITNAAITTTLLTEFPGDKLMDSYLKDRKKLTDRIVTLEEVGDYNKELYYKLFSAPNYIQPDWV